MTELRDYSREETIYTGPETLVYRALHRPSGARVVIKMLTAEVPSARALGRLVHEHQVLTALCQVPGVARARALERLGGTVALVLFDPGWRSLERCWPTADAAMSRRPCGLGASLCASF